MGKSAKERIFLANPIHAELSIVAIDGIEVSLKKTCPVQIEEFTIVGMGIVGSLQLPMELDKEIMYQIRFKWDKQWYEIMGTVLWVEDKRKSPQHAPKFLYGFEYYFPSQKNFTHFYQFFNQYCIQKRVRLLNTQIPNWNQYNAKTLKAIYNPRIPKEM